MKLIVEALDFIQLLQPSFKNSLQFYPKLRLHCFELILWDQLKEHVAASMLLNYRDYLYFEVWLQSQLIAEQTLFLIFRITKMLLEVFSLKLQYLINLSIII